MSIEGRTLRTLLLGSLFFLSNLGCQIPYYLHSAYNQTKLVTTRSSIEQMLKRTDLNEEQKRKLNLVQDVKRFAETELGLNKSKNYTTYVELDRPYVTYIVQAAHAWELKPYLWNFPFVGEVPYKGYFNKDLADKEAQSFSKEDYDTYVRGVSAYSTLGWFNDSVLSTMLRYEDHDLVELIIHETVHTTLFIKNAVDFNERLATYLGQEGMKRYYTKRDGRNAKAIALAELDAHDQKLFSKFISHENELLKKWYVDNKENMSAEKKQTRLNELKERFVKELKPQMKTSNYNEFEKRDINNALLLAYQNYEYNLDDFTKLFDHFHQDYQQVMAYLHTLKGDPKPDKTLKAFVNGSDHPAKL